MRYIFTICFVFFALNARASVNKIAFGEVRVLEGGAMRGTERLAIGDTVFVGDTITTEKQSFVRIRLADGSGAFQIGPTSSVKLASRENTVSTLELLQGYVLSTLKPLVKPSEQLRYQVRTRNAAMGVRGTTFFARVDKDRIFQCICDGRVESTWKHGKAVWKGKHHDTRHFFYKAKMVPAALDLPTNHTDAEIAALKELLQ